MSAAIEAAVLTPASDTQSITHSTCTRPSLSTHTLGSEMAFLNPSRKQPTQPIKLPPQFEDLNGSRRKKVNVRTVELR
ncbi:hypothetical protein MT418_007894 [Batrachochytrium dendrobatidis]